ncbi:ABC transporter ATP-binding protein [Xylophilus sp. GOD-11R]|uniref:ABC transporter ATP-binding protein n=1 Tax=Xylophilus sp. GOD-11R TaxID=3089814 RepID=UPI00298CFEE6|nr:ABC transporter ATP-binding protein [Xylophilus sp. GOD-11R]WPB57632.1 ABC transporter ATP-binding protein [Xylophilus sp. GOD-11R]
MDQIHIRGLRKSFVSAGRLRSVLDDIDLSVATGEVLGLVGPSGCGKSTLLNIVAGLDREHEGAVTIQGRPIGEQLGAGFRVAYVFQEPRLLPWYTLTQNLEFVLEAGGFARAEWARRIDDVLQAVRLGEFRHFYPAQLSGGMQQRASIARAFCIDPDILLLDEPFSALDELTARALRQSLLELWQRFRTTIVFVSHNAFEAAFLADRILVMGEGRIHQELDLRGTARPRSYDDPAVFDASRQVVHHLERQAARQKAARA